jgi:hypothetical protein
LSLTWSYILVGARRCHWAIRLGAWVAFTLLCAGWLSSLLLTNPLHVVGGAALYAAVTFLYFWPRWGHMRLALDFAVTLLCIGVFFATVQFPLVVQDLASNLPIGKTILEGNLRTLAVLAVPLLILIGLDIADFTLAAATWSSEALTRLLPGALLPLVTVGCLLWLLGKSIFHLLAGFATAGTQILVTQLTGPLVLVALLWGAWSSLAAIFPHTREIQIGDLPAAAGKVAVALVVAFLLPLFLSYAAVEIAQIVQTLAVELASGLFGEYSAFVQWASRFYAAASALSATALDYQGQWQQLCAALAIAAAPVLYRRGRAASGLYAITAGITYLWVSVTRPGEPLQAVGWTSPEPVVFAWVLLLLLWSLWHAARKTVSAHSIRTLLPVALILLFMGETNLIAAPLDPIFSLAGVGYLAVGLGWDLLTAGNWANVSSAALPRTSRIFLYLGYVLLTVMLINWAVAAHDFTMLDRFTGEAAIAGLFLLGYPFLYAILYLHLRQPAARNDSREEEAP